MHWRILASLAVCVGAMAIGVSEWYLDGSDWVPLSAAEKETVVGGEYECWKITLTGTCACDWPNGPCTAWGCALVGGVQTCTVPLDVFDDRTVLETKLDIVGEKKEAGPSEPGRRGTKNSAYLCAIGKICPAPCTPDSYGGWNCKPSTGPAYLFQVGDGLDPETAQCEGAWEI